MNPHLRAVLAGITILAAAACLVLGLTVPIVKLSYLYFWSNTYSLTAIVQELYQTGELFLAAVIFLFSVAFPAFKLIYLLVAFITPGMDRGHGGTANRLHKRLAWLGKWSMLDVLVLALVVFYAKSSYLADAVALPGVYLFTASVLLTMLAYAFVEARDEGAAWAQPQPLIENKTRRPDSAPSAPDREHR